jgi:hypothetical protein
MVLFLQPISRFPTHSRLSIYTGFRFGNSAGTPFGGWEGYRGVGWVKRHRTMHRTLDQAYPLRRIPLRRIPLRPNTPPSGAI